MAFGDALSVLDNFNRGDESPPTGWSMILGAGNTLDLVSNALSQIVAEEGTGYWDDATFGPACEVAITIATKPDANRAVKICARLKDVGSANWDGYFAYAMTRGGADRNRLYRVDNGVGTELGTTEAREFSAGDDLGLECDANDVITHYYNSGSGWTASSTCTATDTTYQAAGYLGFIIASENVGVYDDFSGGTAGAAGPTQQSTGGTLVLTGVSWQTTFRDQDVAGTLTLTGTVATMFKSFLELAGTLTLTGAISTLFKSFLEFAGTLTLSGTVSTMFKSFLEFAGTLTLSGAVSDFKLALSRFLGGTLTLAGAISRKLALDRVLVGTLNLAGTLSLKSIWKRTLTGILALGGAVSSRLRTALALAGTLTLSGAVDRTTKWLRTLAGALSSSGAISKKLTLSKILTGTLNFVGAVSLKSLWKRTLAGVLAFSSSLATVLTRAPAGRIITGFIKLALTPVGVIKMWIKR